MYLDVINCHSSLHFFAQTMKLSIIPQFFPKLRLKGHCKKLPEPFVPFTYSFVLVKLVFMSRSVLLKDCTLVLLLQWQ